MSSLAASSSSVAVSVGPWSESETRLQGRGLPLARVVWIAIVVPTYILFVANIPAFFVSLHLLYVPNGQMFTVQPTYADVHTLQAWGLSLDFYAICVVTVSLLFQFSYASVGVLLFWRKSDDRIALFTSFALMMLPFGFANITLQALPPGWSWLIPTLTTLGNASLLLCGFVFPDGQFVPRWTRWLAMVMLGYWVVVAVFPSWQLDRSVLSLVLFFGFVVTTMLIQLYRYRYVSTPPQRQQTKWAIFGVLIAVVGNIGPRLLYDFVFLPLLGGGGLAFALEVSLIMCLMLAIPLTLGIAILRYRLWDIDILINRTLVYSILTTSVVAIYVVVVVALGTLFQAAGNLVISLFATGLIAVLFQPLRSHLQRAVNRLMYGERDDPYAVLSRLGRRLEATLAPEAILPTVVETVALALKLPYAAITLKQEQQLTLAASYGSPAETAQRLPLLYQRELVGELILAPRRHGEAFSPADRRLLDDLARQAGVAAHAIRLTADLQRSRERLVTTREEERRRLRRDLHDGLGPTLAALNLQAGVVRTLIKSDPVTADALVGEWRAELRAVIADIRRLVYELRPPVLDELGLAAAIRERAAQYRAHAETDALQVGVETPDELPPLPAAVEVAAYRIAQEALANVVRHAQARTCCIRLWIDEALHLEIIDDGVGLPAEHHSGVGLLSMGERAAELGGTCVIESISAGGTRVYARLPLSKE